MYQDSFITIEQGKEYQARKESVYDKNSFFSPCYQQAADCLIEIVKVGQVFVDGHKDMNSSHSPAASAAINKDLVGYPNNIIAFCAERGQGKTTAMVSFANALREIPQHNRRNHIHDEKTQFWRNSDVLDCQFVVVDRIDPTTMEDGDSILKTVLSRMFNLFQVEWERRTGTAAFDSYNGQGNLLDNRSKILNRFQNCYRSLQVIEDHSVKENTDSLEQMLELGDSANLRGAIYLLTQSFLSFMCSASTENSCLVIQIDDADFNIELAYNIIDDIRRYLVLPQVVVLLSANMTQLETTVEQHFIAQYATSIKNNGMASVERCHNIAERYISKVIPAYHRIFLPDLQKYVPSQYDHIQVKYLNAEGKNILEERSSQGAIYYYQDQLLRLLYQCTGLIFLKPESFLHNLLPGNMRELTHFLSFFSRLDKLNKPNEPGINYFSLVDHFSGKKRLADGMIDLWRANLSKLEHYLMELWAPINLRTEGHVLLRSLQSDPDDNKNRNLLRLLPDYYGRERVQSSQINGNVTLDWTVYRDQFKEICRSHGLSIYTAGPADGSITEYERASYADVCEALNVLSSLPESNRQYKLIYAIHLLYTIRLNQLLLDQIELLELSVPPAKNMLALFLADVLFKREDLKTEPQGYALWQYDIRTADFYKLFRVYQLENQKVVNRPGTNQRGISLIAALCRRVERVNHVYVTEPHDSPRKRPAYEDLPLQFNFFYSNLRDIDMLMINSNALRRELRNEVDPSRRNQMAGSFALLLNWDVQYEFLRNLRNYRRESLNVLQNIRSIYGGQSTCNLLAQISHLTDSPDYEDVFEFYTNYYKPEMDAFGAMIQCVIPEIKRNILPHMKKGLNALQEWVDQKISSENKKSAFRNIEDFATTTHCVTLAELQTMINPLLYLHEEDLAQKEGNAIDWTLEEVQSALKVYASVLKAEMAREGIPYDTQKSGADQ